MKKQNNVKAKVQKVLKPQARFKNYDKKNPILSAYFLYLEEERWKSVRDQSKLTMNQIVKQAYDNFNFHLTNEQKDVFYEKAQQIKNESDAKEYLKMLEQTYTIQKKIKKIKQTPQLKMKK
ncbi:unnamed protein product [Paramecium sonneborni]|uniref:Uncharacterized protein n=1 Tax=Paramecium sonneborni TaxID=65129 RepID=A0A8S1RBL1_9CILI|nr:unnamed protein product [Paramecium sonneborni]